MLDLKSYGLGNLIKCPHCGKDANFYIVDNRDDIVFMNYTDFTKTVADFEHYSTLTCVFCEKTIFVHYETCGNRLFHLYPSMANIDHVSDEIAKMSPKFFEIYKQVLQANESNLNELVGAGLHRR